MKEFIEIMQSLLLYMKDADNPCITCEHDVLIIQGIDFTKMTRDIMADFVDKGFFPGNPFDEFNEAQKHLDDYCIRDEETDDGSCFTEEDFRMICEECQDSLYSWKYGSC